MTRIGDVATRLKALEEVVPETSLLQRDGTRHAFPMDSFIDAGVAALVGDPMRLSRRELRLIARSMPEPYEPDIVIALRREAGLALKGRRLLGPLVLEPVGRVP